MGEFVLLPSAAIRRTLKPWDIIPASQCVVVAAALACALTRLHAFVGCLAYFVILVAAACGVVKISVFYLWKRTPTTPQAPKGTPPPLRKHGQGQKNNGHSGSPCLDKPVLARDAQHKETLHTGNLPVPHTKHITHKHGTRTQRVGKI